MSETFKIDENILAHVENIHNMIINEYVNKQEQQNDDLLKESLFSTESNFESNFQIPDYLFALKSPVKSIPVIPVTETMTVWRFYFFILNSNF